MNHKAWIDNEYKLWTEALEESTVHNFKEHPQVKRMLGEINRETFSTPETIAAVTEYETDLINIDNIGRTFTPMLSGSCIRMIYWALEVLKHNPKSICEIGGGVGEFYAILRILGYKGGYYIYDLAEVNIFQYKYLREIQKLTGLDVRTAWVNKRGFCVSFYALGEFDDELKGWYIKNVVNNCEHGLIVWAPHSGASEEINFKHNITVSQEGPCKVEGSKLITW